MNFLQFRKSIAYLIITLICIIGLVHAWRPITLSPTESGERVGFTFILLFLAWAFYSGYRYARLTIGFAFAFCSVVNLLILLAYFNKIESNNLLEMVFWTVTLSGISFILLRWKGIRVFEEEKQKQTV